MKILVFGQIYPDSFAKNILVTLKRMGHHVSSVEHSLSTTGSIRYLNLIRYAMRFFPYMEERWFQGLIRQAQAVKPDLIVNIVGNVPPQVVKQLKQHCHAAVVLWFPDHMVNFDRQYAFASEYDAYFFKDRFIVGFVRDKVGKRAFFVPEACNPLWHRRVELTDDEKRFYGCDLTLAGNMHYYRALIFEHFLAYDFKMWGTYYPPWLKSQVKTIFQNYHVAELEKAKAFSAAKIVLNVMHYGEVLGVNCRTFEAAGCGAFQILDWKPNLHEFFEPEKEVVTFRTLAELKEKVRYYLEHERERQEIADRAYERAHREHTYEHRLKRLLDLTFGIKSDEE